VASKIFPLEGEELYVRGSIFQVECPGCIYFVSCRYSQTSPSPLRVSPQNVNGRRWRKLLNFHGYVFSGYCPLGCGSVYLRRWIATFQRNLLLSSTTSTFVHVQPQCWCPSTSPQGVWVRKTLSERNGRDPEVTYMSRNITTRLVWIIPGWINPKWQVPWCARGSRPCPYYAPRHEAVLCNACVECWVDAFYRFSNLILLDKGKCADKVPIPLTTRSKT